MTIVNTDNNINSHCYHTRPSLPKEYFYQRIIWNTGFWYSLWK